MNSKQKEQYLTPTVEIIRMDMEGVIATSGLLPTVPDGGSAMKSYSPQTHYNAASSSELEDFINDILTIEQ